MSKLVFLKLGGSLITDKTKPYTPRLDKLNEVCGEIGEALRSDPELRLVLGHGSGSFGHEAASRYHTRDGVSGPEAWRGFTEVWYQAATLNRFIMEALHQAGVSAIALAPAASVTARAGRVAAWDLTPLRSALQHGLLPVVYGDVIFDSIRGGTILSTEELFAHLVVQLHPQRILLAGQEVGVWADFPGRRQLIGEITPGTFPTQAMGLRRAEGSDVTGGMRVKVSQMVALVMQFADLEISIFSGDESGNIRRALKGELLGTTIHG